MSNFYHKVYWVLFWIFFLLLTPFTATFAPRSQELFWLFIVQPAVALLIAWICVRALIALSENLKRGREANEERRRRAKARVQAEANRVKTEAARVDQHRAAQQRLSSRLNSLVSQSVASARELPNLITEADNFLDKAEHEFGRRAFVPFWDAIEAAAKKLVTVETTVQQLIQNSQFYQKDAYELETAAPPFQLGLDTLPDTSRTANRMREVFSRTETDFEFSSIYQQRTTNKLLVAGFSTIAQAIEELPDRLQSSLGQLASSVSIGISDLASRMASSQERMALAVTTEIRRAGNTAAESARKEAEMLNNIQRRKYPKPRGIGEGDY